MGRAIKAVSVACLFLCLAAGCNTTTESNPHQVINQYVDSYLNGRFEQAEALLSKSYGIPPNKRYPDIPFEQRMVRQTLASRISYTIGKIDIRGDRAFASMNMSAPDFSRITADIVADSRGRQIPNDNLEAFTAMNGLLDQFIRKYKEQGIPYRTTSRDFELVKENGEWKISRGALKI